MTDQPTPDKTGPHGVAWRVPVERPRLVQDTTIEAWMLAGSWHPLWSQFVVAAISLADAPGVPPAKRHFPEASHEIFVAALGPDTPFDPARLHEQMQLRYLEPIDVVHQVQATDAEMRTLLPLLVQAGLDGRLPISTDDARDAYSALWRETIALGLEHLRGAHGHPENDPTQEETHD